MIAFSLVITMLVHLSCTIWTVIRVYNFRHIMTLTLTLPAGEKSSLWHWLQWCWHQWHEGAKRLWNFDRKAATDLACYSSCQDDIKNWWCYFPIWVLIYLFLNSCCMSRCRIADGILFDLYDFSQSLYFNLKYIYVKILARLCIGVGSPFSFFMIKADCSFVWCIFVVNLNIMNSWTIVVKIELHRRILCWINRNIVQCAGCRYSIWYVCFWYYMSN